MIIAIEKEIGRFWKFWEIEFIDILNEPLKYKTVY